MTVITSGCLINPFVEILIENKNLHKFTRRHRLTYFLLFQFNLNKINIYVGKIFSLIHSLNPTSKLSIASLFLIEGFFD